MQTMFHKLSVDVCAERRSYEAKLAAQEEELKVLRAALHQQDPHSTHTAISQETKKKSKIDLLSNEITSVGKKTIKETHPTASVGGASPPTQIQNLSGLMRPTTSSALHAKPKIRMSQLPKPISASKVLSERNTNQSNRISDSSEPHDSSSDDEEADSQYDDTSSSIDELDESFFPEEDLSDVSDEEEEEQIRTVPKQDSFSSTTSNKKRSSKELEQDDTSTDSSQKQPKKLKSQSSVEELKSIDSPSFPLSRYKVPELKKFLSDRSLPVSGTRLPFTLPSPLCLFPSPSLSLSLIYWP
jgi:hypothetical protein